MSRYNFLIVGAGLTGAVLAHELAQAGHRCLVVEKRDHIGGNCYTEKVEAAEGKPGIVTGVYGGHIFHTNSRRIWKYVQQFSEWQQYEHRVKVTYQGAVYSFPPNLMTLQQLDSKHHGFDYERAIREMFFEGYNLKMWGKPLSEIPKSVTGRVPIRNTWDDRYFDDLYQGLPEGGYTPMLGNMLAGANIELSVDFLADRNYWEKQAGNVIYTGPLDAYFSYDLGRLEYRSLRFEQELLEIPSFQGVATMNYTSADIPCLRIEEWRYWWKTPADIPGTVITRTFAEGYDGNNEPYYPVEDERNRELHKAYTERAATIPNWHYAGRLGQFRYYDMDQCIGAALSLCQKVLA